MREPSLKHADGLIHCVDLSRYTTGQFDRGAGVVTEGLCIEVRGATSVWRKGWT